MYVLSANLSVIFIGWQNWTWRLKQQVVECISEWESKDPLMCTREMWSWDRSAAHLPTMMTRKTMKRSSPDPLEWKHWLQDPTLLLLLLLLSHFNHVWLCATPCTAAYQASPSMGFSRQEHWSGFAFPSPMHESEKWKWSRSVMSDSATPWTAAYQAPPSMGFQARVLEWVASAFSITYTSFVHSDAS